MYNSVCTLYPLNLWGQQYDFFLKEINTFIQQGWIKLIKSNGKHFIL